MNPANRGADEWSTFWFVLGALLLTNSIPDDWSFWRRLALLLGVWLIAQSVVLNP